MAKRIYNLNSSIIGLRVLGQAVFESDKQKYSPEDLEQFQNENNVLPLEVIDVNQHNETHCTENQCMEGNLDVQVWISSLTCNLYIF